MGTVGSDDGGLQFWHWGRQKLQAIRRLCNRMLNCWALNESWTVDITERLIQKLSAVFPTKNLLELGGDECDNLNFMNFKTDSFKIRKNSWILGIFKTFKIHKIPILNLRFDVRQERHLACKNSAHKIPKRLPGRIRPESKKTRNENRGSRSRSSSSISRIAVFIVVVVKTMP